MNSYCKLRKKDFDRKENYHNVQKSESAVFNFLSVLLSNCGSLLHFFPFFLTLYPVASFSFGTLCPVASFNPLQLYERIPTGTEEFFCGCMRGCQFSFPFNIASEVVRLVTSIETFTLSVQAKIRL
jgi:hypothetical protein